MERILAGLSERGTVALGLFDLDGFKAYNDTFGHPAGDVLLARLGRRLATTLEGRAIAWGAEMRSRCKSARCQCVSEFLHPTGLAIRLAIRKGRR